MKGSITQYESDTLRKLQLAELEILDAIDTLCREEHIEYFLDGGSALGALRHEGFIPWDDDIDIGMSRSDYDRFIDAARNSLPDTMALALPGETHGYSMMFAKVMRKDSKFYTKETIEAGFDQGIFVDIFPYDDLDPDPEIAKRQLKNGRLWQSASYLYHSKTIVVPHRGAIGFVERAACRAAHYLMQPFFSEESITAHFNESIDRSIEGSTHCATLAWANSNGYKTADLLPTRPSVFEGRSFPVPGNVETYLNRTYGSNWHELPPPELRTNHAPVVLEFPPE